MEEYTDPKTSKTETRPIMRNGEYIYLDDETRPGEFREDIEYSPSLMGAYLDNYTPTGAARFDYKSKEETSSQKTSMLKREKPLGSYDIYTPPDKPTMADPKKPWYVPKIYSDVVKIVGEGAKSTITVPTDKFTIATEYPKQQIEASVKKTISKYGKVDITSSEWEQLELSKTGRKFLVDKGYVKGYSDQQSMMTKPMTLAQKKKYIETGEISPEYFQVGIIQPKTTLGGAVKGAVSSLMGDLDKETARLTGLSKLPSGDELEQAMQLETERKRKEGVTLKDLAIAYVTTPAVGLMNLNLLRIKTGVELPKTGEAIADFQKGTTLGAYKRVRDKPFSSVLLPVVTIGTLGTAGLVASTKSKIVATASQVVGKAALGGFAGVRAAQFVKADDWQKRGEIVGSTAVDLGVLKVGGAIVKSEAIALKKMGIEPKTSYITDAIQKAKYTETTITDVKVSLDTKAKTDSIMGGSVSKATLTGKTTVTRVTEKGYKLPFKLGKIQTKVTVGTKSYPLTTEAAMEAYRGGFVGKYYTSIDLGQEGQIMGFTKAPGWYKVSDPSKGMITGKSVMYTQTVTQPTGKPTIYKELVGRQDFSATQKFYDPLLKTPTYEMSLGKYGVDSVYKGVYTGDITTKYGIEGFYQDVSSVKLSNIQLYKPLYSQVAKYPSVNKFVATEQGYTYKEVVPKITTSTTLDISTGKTAISFNEVPQTTVWTAGKLTGIDYSYKDVYTGVFSDSKINWVMDVGTYKIPKPSLYDGYVSKSPGIEQFKPVKVEPITKTQEDLLRVDRIQESFSARASRVLSQVYAPTKTTYVEPPSQLAAVLTPTQALATARITAVTGIKSIPLSSQITPPSQGSQISSLILVPELSTKLATDTRKDTLKKTEVGVISAQSLKRVLIQKQTSDLSLYPVSVLSLTNTLTQVQTAKLTQAQVKISAQARATKLRQQQELITTQIQTPILTPVKPPPIFTPTKKIPPPPIIPVNIPFKIPLPLKTRPARFRATPNFTFSRALRYTPTLGGVFIGKQIRPTRARAPSRTARRTSISPLAGIRLPTTRRTPRRPTTRRGRKLQSELPFGELGQRTWTGFEIRPML